MLDHPERLDLTQLLAAAHQNGFEASGRLVTDWVSLGLLDIREHHGSGQGRGSEKGTWPVAQRDLFLAHLQVRREIRHVAALANLPVAAWLFDGEDLVELRQVRRALETWCSRQHFTKAAARRLARQLVADFGTDGRHDKAPLIDFLVEAIAADEQPDLDAVLRQIQKLGPGQTMVAGAFQIEVSPQVLAEQIVARVYATLGIKTFTEAEFHWARYIFLRARMQYMEVAAELSAHQRLGHLFEDTGLSRLIRHACLEFVSVLGLLAFKERFDPTRTDLDSPDVWRARNLRTRIVRTEYSAKGFAIGVEVFESGMSAAPPDPDIAVRQTLVIGHQAFYFRATPAWVHCNGCSREVSEAVAYSAALPEELRHLEPGGIEPVVFCVNCARQRARDVVGTVRIDGADQLVRIEAWSLARPDDLDVVPASDAADGSPGASISTRRIPVVSFTPLHP